jgi:hypothetical protein
MSLTKVTYSMISGTPTNILDFMTSAQVADALAGTRTLNLQAVLQTAVNVCIATGTALYIPSAIKSMRVDTPVVIDYATLGQKTLSIFGDAVTGYYQGGMGSEIYYSGTSGYLFQIDGRAADVGGVNEGSPMPVTFTGINFAGTASAYGAIKFSRASFGRVKDCNFYGFANASYGVVTLSANGVTATSVNAFCGEITISGNYFASSGRCIWLTGSTGGVVNVVRVFDNVALDQSYFVAVDFGANVPYAESLFVIGNHVEGNLQNDIYTQGATSNLVVTSNYFEQNNAAYNSARINVQGSNNFGIYIEENTFSKSLASAAASSALVIIANTSGVSAINNQSNYGGATDRFSVDLTTCINAVAEPFVSNALPLYPVRMNNYVMRTGRVTNQWRETPAAGSGGFIGISSGDGFPGGTVCTLSVDQSKNNAQIRLNVKATITTKSGGGTSTLIGVFPYANFGIDTYFPVYTTNVTGTKPFYGVLPAGLTVATIYDANGAALNYQTACAVGSIFNAVVTYITQA